MEAEKKAVKPTVVVLDNLPSVFTEQTLKSILKHIPLKGQVVHTEVVESDEGVLAHVSFEKAEDADAAIRLWDSLTVDGMVISASSLTETPGKPQPKRVVKQSTAAQQTSSGMKYPFAPMNITWLVEYVNSLKNPNKSFTMVRILECLMGTAVTTTDPYLEYAVVHFYTKFTAQQWGKAQTLMSDGVAFELCRQVFEVIGLVRKYPGANPKSRKMLLSLVERLADDISKVSLETKTLNVNKAIPEIITSVRQQVNALRENTDPDPEPLTSLVSWLKFLFACLSTHQNNIPTFPEQSTVTHCGEDCACFAKIKNKFAVVISDVEKAKVIDSLIIAAIRDTDEFVGNIAHDLTDRYPSVLLSRAVRHIHNGKFMLLRSKLFDAICTTKSVSNLSSAARCYDVIEIAVLAIKEEVQDHRQLKSLLPLINSTLTCILDLRSVPDVSAAAVQQLYTLQFDLSQIFNALCAPQFQLCVYVNEASAETEAGIESVPASVPRSKAVKCTNPNCTVTSESKDLLKCSGCKVTFYCSVECQRSDWKSHKTLCREIAARKSTVEPAEPYREERVLKPMCMPKRASS